MNAAQHTHFILMQMRINKGLERST